jgi:hypothetical protein
MKTFREYLEEAAADKTHQVHAISIEGTKMKSAAMSHANAKEFHSDLTAVHQADAGKTKHTSKTLADKGRYKAAGWHQRAKPESLKIVKIS